MVHSSVNRQEVNSFNQFADQWWDYEGPFKPLHITNNARIRYIKDSIALYARNKLQDSTILDIGCGGGLLSVPLSRLGAKVTGIDPAKDTIDAAIAHAKTMDIDIQYYATNVEEFYCAHIDQFDIITIMEVVEHVDNIDIFLDQAIDMLRPGGLLFVSTLNRTWQSLLKAIVIGEYLTNIIPPGTHDWNNFIKPSEIYRMIKDRCSLIESRGIDLNLSMNQAFLTKDLSVNYISCYTKI